MNPKMPSLPTTLNKMVTLQYVTKQINFNLSYIFKIPHIFQMLRLMGEWRVPWWLWCVCLKYVLLQITIAHLEWVDVILGDILLLVDKLAGSNQLDTFWWDVFSELFCWDISLGHFGEVYFNMMTLMMMRRRKGQPGGDFFPYGWHGFPNKHTNITIPSIHKQH